MEPFKNPVMQVKFLSDKLLEAQNRIYELERQLRKVEEHA